VRIRPADETDLAALVNELGQEPFFVDRLKRQANDLGLLLTAWLGDRPIGDVYLWLEPAEEQPIREHLPRTPLLTHLEVHPAYRNRGTGTELIRATEKEAANRDHDQLALGVELHNHHAMRLYQRLGYREWSYSTVECFALDDGAGSRTPEVCRIMFKHLQRGNAIARPGQAMTALSRHL